MKQKLKGCRPSKDVMQDYSNVSAQLGDTVFQIDRGHSIKQQLRSLKQQLLERQRELMLEMNSAQEQEKAAADAQAKEDAPLKAEQVQPDTVPNG